MNYETEFIRQFVTAGKRRRYLALLQSRKGREKLLEALDHFQDLDMQRAKLLPTNAQTASQIYALLKQKGAP